MTTNKYDWVDFYKEFAKVLLDYKENREILVSKVKDIYQKTGINLPTLEKDNNIIANITVMRDEIGQANIHGTLPNTWMITEAAYAPYLFDVTVAGKKTYLTKGTWELKNDFMAGPFVNYAIKDTKNNRYLILEGFTYNPSKSKRDLVFELEAIIQSVKFLK